MNKRQNVGNYEQYGIFGLITTEKGVKIACGNKLVTDKTFENNEEAKKFIDSKDYEIIWFIACHAANMLLNYQNNDSKS